MRSNVPRSRKAEHAHKEEFEEEENVELERVDEEEIHLIQLNLAGNFWHLATGSWLTGERLGNRLHAES